MKPVDEIALRQMVKAIVEEVDPEQVILFGSHARGEATPDSDVDFVVVETLPFGDSRDRRKEATVQRVETLLEAVRRKLAGMEAL